MKQIFENRSNSFWDLLMFINIILFIIFIKTNILVIPFYIGITCYLFKEYGYKTRFKNLNNRGKRNA
ncbi:hypothetical protein BTM29_02695 [Companilactobacillus allii]|uniref:Uncharacterized protein n=1 Tax=Companilactobacillus allii TaxID=1847728 RepID=A0A1P8Q0Y0_9LACO|nr:hypothetical protein BTM29_02695 [Companilactobacillus allii]